MAKARCKARPKVCSCSMVKISCWSKVSRVKVESLVVQGCNFFLVGLLLVVSLRRRGRIDSFSEEEEDEDEAADKAKGETNVDVGCGVVKRFGLRRFNDLLILVGFEKSLSCRLEFKWIRPLLLLGCVVTDKAVTTSEPAKDVALLLGTGIG